VTTRTPTVALTTLIVACAVMLAFGFGDASALSVTTPSVTVDVNEAGVNVDVRASVAAYEPATEPPSAATQPAEQQSEVVEVAVQPKADPPPVEVAALSATPAHHSEVAAVPRTNGAASPSRSDASPGRSRASEPAPPADTRPGESPRSGAQAPQPGALAQPTTSSPAYAAPAPRATNARRGERGTGARRQRREHRARGTGQPAPSPFAAPAAAGAAASPPPGGGGAVAATLVIMLGFAASPASSLLRTRNRIWRPPDVAHALERPG
jgi:hypothetical protein